MADCIITIRGPGEFRADMIMEPTAKKMTLCNFRTLLKLAVASDGNTEDLKRMGEWLSEYLDETKAAWEEASRRYQSLWRNPTGLYRSEQKAIRAENNHLSTALRSAHAAHQRAEKLCEAYNKIYLI